MSSAVGNCTSTTTAMTSVLLVAVAGCGFLMVFGS